MQHRRDRIRLPVLLGALAVFGLFLGLLSWTTTAVRVAQGAEDEVVQEPSQRTVVLEAGDRPPVDTRRGTVREAFRQAYTDPEEIEVQAAAPVDPQMSVYRSSFAEGDTPPFVPLQFHARHVRSSGLDLSPTTSCEVRLLPVHTGSFTCVIRVTCGDVVVYPNSAETAGFVACEIEGASPVRASDRHPTSIDGDPSIQLDLRARTVTVRDTSPDLEVVLSLENATPIRRRS